CWIWSTSHGNPYTCTPRIADVRGVIEASILSASMTIVFEVMSQNTGRNPFQLMQWGVAGNVNGVVITCEPAGRLRAFNATSKANVPLLKSDTCGAFNV